jgi:hypothetical protein
MPQYGSSQNLISTNLSQTVDNQGNPIISSDTGFAASPLGYAARAQALFGLPNSTFELTPPDTNAVISAGNPLPYWDVQDYSSAVMSGSAIYDSTTNSWGVNLNPGTADTNDYITMTTRSYLINDSNLSLRQQALAVVSKVGTYAGTTQWNLELTAAYYDLTNTLLHSGTVATIYDNATWTSMAGTTTTGGTAISASAHYVDLQFKLLATAPVTSATSVTIKSCLLQTSTGTGGAQSFLITDTFTSSGTWTKPTGVNNIVAIVAVGGGGGGSGGDGRKGLSNNYVAPAGGVGGGSSRWVYVRDVNVANISTITIGIGAGGAGGAGGTVIKTAAEATGDNYLGTLGGAGGTTTVGTYITVLGGGAGGTAAGVPTTTLFGGFAGTLPSTAGTNNANGTSSATTYTTLPYTTVITGTGTNGGSTTINAGTGVNDVGNIGTAGASGYLGSGGGGGSAQIGGGTTSNSGWNGGVGGGGGAAGGVERVFGVSGTAAVSITGTAGNGGSAVANSGAGGGGGGAVGIYGGTATGAGGSAQYRASSGTVFAGTGGNGGSGAVFIAYVG